MPASTPPPAPPVTDANADTAFDPAAFLTQANLSLIATRREALALQERAAHDTTTTPQEQIAACARVIAVPFLRMNKRARANAHFATFISAGRGFNRILIAAKVRAAARLETLSKDESLPGPTRRLAAATSARARLVTLDLGEVSGNQPPEPTQPPTPPRTTRAGSGNTNASTNDHADDTDSPDDTIPDDFILPEKLLATCTTAAAAALENTEVDPTTAAALTSIRIPIGKLTRNFKDRPKGKSR